MATKKKRVTKKNTARRSAQPGGRVPRKKAPVAKRAAISKPRPKQARKPLARPSMFRKIAFTMLQVTDPTRARAFYEQTLGFTRGLASPDGVWTEYDLPEGGCLALFCHPDPKFRKPPGGASVAFEVADLDAVNDRLRAAGVRYEGELIHGPNCRMSNVEDSEGNSLILHQLNRR